MFGSVQLRGGSVVPADALAWRFSRSSGPGGQSVNTADSRVELLVDLDAVLWSSPAQRARALAGLADRRGAGLGAAADARPAGPAGAGPAGPGSAGAGPAGAGSAGGGSAGAGPEPERQPATAGVLRVVASEHRSQLRNREAALARARVILDEALAPAPPTRRASRPSRASRARRVQSETRRRDVKGLRRRPQS